MERRPEAERGQARAGDVLGEAARKRIDPRWQSHFDQLTDMRERLAGRRHDLTKISETEAADHSINPADHGTEEYDLGARFGQFGNDQEALYEIDQALRRIEDGNYGVCEATGHAIPAERLEAVPWARFAKDVEAGVEADRAAKKPRHVW